MVGNTNGPQLSYVLMGSVGSFLMDPDSEITISIFDTLFFTIVDARVPLTCLLSMHEQVTK